MQHCELPIRIRQHEAESMENEGTSRPGRKTASVAAGNRDDAVA